MPDRKEHRRNITAAGLGNVLEWYDFGVYGFFAVSIGKHFFPSDDPFASLLSAFGAYAVGSAARPIGALVFGNIGDKFGRLPALKLSIVLMGGATFAIGIMPGYEQIGVAAPLLLVFLRLTQGFAVSGEYSSSTVFLVEQAPKHRRGFVSSWSMFGSMVGVLIGSAVGAAVSTALPDEAVQDWGWRIPFLLSAIFAVAGYLLRRDLAESTAIDAADRPDGQPVLSTIRTEWPMILRYIGIITMGGCGFYLAYVFAVTDLTEHMKISTAKALDINTVALFSILFIIPLSGYLSDRIGRRPLALFASFGTFVLAWPLWWMMHQPNFAVILIGQIGYAVLFATGWSVYALMVTENLSLRARVTVISIGNGVAYGIFGGMTPFVATYLVERTADDFAPVYLLMGLAAISLIAVLGLPETHNRPLPDET